MSSCWKPSVPCYPLVCLLPLQHFFNGAAACNLASRATTQLINPVPGKPLGWEQTLIRVPTDLPQHSPCGPSRSQHRRLLPGAMGTAAGAARGQGCTERPPVLLGALCTSVLGREQWESCVRKDYPTLMCAVR